MRHGCATQIIGTLGPKRDGFKPKDGDRTFYSLDILVPGQSFRVNCSEDQFRAAREDQEVKAMCKLENSKNGLRLALVNLEVVTTAADARTTGNGSAERPVAAASAAK